MGRAITTHQNITFGKRDTPLMAETAAGLTDHVLPCVPVLQWMPSVRKRLLYFMQRDRAARNTALCIFLRVIAQNLQDHPPGRSDGDIGQILEHIGAWAEPPHLSPARGPPLWDDCDAQVREGADGKLNGYMA